MAQEQVIVTSLADGGVWVETQQQSACGSCQARAGCGQSAMQKLGRRVTLWVATDEALNVGDTVLLELPAGGLAISAVALYGLPLVGLTAGAVLGQQTGGEIAALMVAGLGLVAGLLLARRVSARYQHVWQPRVLASTASRPLANDSYV